ncbi:Uncharacterised protein [uncultured archaeon]|nr:Uncharacterised protein [uncultured archaeon]
MVFSRLKRVFLKFRARYGPAGNAVKQKNASALSAADKSAWYRAWQKEHFELAQAISRLKRERNPSQDKLLASKIARLEKLEEDLPEIRRMTDANASSKKQGK